MERLRRSHRLAGSVETTCCSVGVECPPKAHVPGVALSKVVAPQVVGLVEGA